MARLKDVARKAGVSIGTVSKILNDPQAARLFTPDCIRRVRAAARRLAYSPNYLARSLQTGRANAIGMVLHCAAEAGVPFWFQMIDGVMAGVRHMGYHFVTIGAVPGSGGIEVGLRFLRERRIDALIVPRFAVGSGLPEALDGVQAPVILASVSEQTDLPVVDLDDAHGIAEAVGHLAGLGHRRLLWVFPSGAPHPSVGRRARAFWEAVGSLGLEGRELGVERVFDADPASLTRQISLAREAVSECARAGADFTALVCYDESIAFGAYAALGGLGMRIPRDVSVVGFDDIYACVAWPPMTVVSHMLEAIGRRAAELAVRIVEAQGEPAVRPGHRECIPAQLVIRQSTGPAPR